MRGTETYGVMCVTLTDTQVSKMRMRIRKRMEIRKRLEKRMRLKKKMRIKMKMEMRMEMRKRPKIRTMFKMILPAIAGARDLCDPNVPASACEYRTCKTLHPHENTQTSQNINKHRARNIKENANFLFQAIFGHWWCR